MKTQSTDLTTATDASVVAPFWLIEIDLSPTVYYTTADGTISYGAQSYLRQDFRVSNLTIGTSGAANAVVTFQGVDNVFTALFRAGGGTEGSAVRIAYSAKQASYTVSTDVVQVVDSTIDSLSLNSSQVILRLGRQPIYPNKRVDVANGFTFVTAAGSVQFPAGNQVLN